MLAAAQRGDFHYLVVAEQKALGRESYETQHTIKRLAQAGVDDVVLHGRPQPDAPQLRWTRPWRQSALGDEHTGKTPPAAPTKPTGRKCSGGSWSVVGCLATETSM